MKKVLNKKSVWQAALSLMVLITFILIAVGSFGDITSQLGIGVYTDVLNDGRLKEREDHPNGLTRTYTGYEDDDGRWHGKIKIEYAYPDIESYTEEVYMEHGVRQGLCTRTYASGRIEEEHYFNGVKYDFKGAKDLGKSGINGFHILKNKYPWFLSMFNAFGYDSAYVKAYIDTVETLINNYAFDEAEFDNYYDDVLDELSETPYDSIITQNTSLVYLHGLQEMKHDELRLAVIGHYRSESIATYDVVKTSYPNYLLSMNDEGVNDQDFEAFCHDLDDTLTLYGPLDPEDPFFADSVDSRLFISLLSFMETDESIITLVKQFIKTPDAFSSINSFINQQVQFYAKNNIRKLNMTSPEVAEVATGFMIFRLFDADLIKKAVYESYLSNNGVAFIPAVATKFSAHNSATSVSLEGYVIEDGGADVTEQGIAWAVYYNPTTSDAIISSDAGSDNFTITLDRLTEGTTYYARTYATNKAGTAYGNCISFVPSVTAVGIHTTDMPAYNFTIYPNPASALTTFKFKVEKTESIMLSIIDMKGQVALEFDPGKIALGENKIHMDLSGLPDGIYICRMSNSASILATKKLVIAH